ncbi:hypothetical protein T552_02108 [Pneumocystis carinii B80]|uniref:DASH complex subunit SPC34 n=1 Tax=Pneumocystis carinii (strain B80) TaxID=1408658 RepID=A0A0W4ZH21_PNEC8|nr:hypothetical protein T552_02108 [Pneumocystis carinii B80]KTW27668.1 hypothetical protein T552_02108 [Pneumocystis carinii B80]
MMKIEEYFPSIEQAIDSIESLEFNYPKPFTNSLLKLQDIVMLIRDAEGHESRLFSVEKGKKEGEKKGFCQALEVPVTPLKNKELQSPEILLEAAEKLLNIYQFPEIEERIGMLFEKNRKHLKNIQDLEAKIESQRMKLDLLLTNNDFNFEDKNEIITDEMIQEEKDEVARLEYELEMRSKELRENE